MAEQMTCPRCGGEGKVSGTLPERLRMLREESGQRQDDVCEATGISHAVLCRIEQGRTEHPSIYKIAKIAAHYGVTIDSLLGKEE